MLGIVDGKMIVIFKKLLMQHSLAAKKKSYNKKFFNLYNVQMFVKNELVLMYSKFEGFFSFNSVF